MVVVVLLLLVVNLPRRSIIPPLMQRDDTAETTKTQRQMDHLPSGHLTPNTHPRLRWNAAGPAIKHHSTRDRTSPRPRESKHDMECGAGTMSQHKCRCVKCFVFILFCTKFCLIVSRALWVRQGTVLTFQVLPHRDDGLFSSASAFSSSPSSATPPLLLPRGHDVSQCASRSIVPFCPKN
ncbi:hypothetical protein BDP81DRAFT_1909 [Colletotrichum phormii]|uniref:Secreted protein n=1 Tax=Colletotrichum phormii TaxID=359342 RepID=A0AAJ0A5A6_9PEZI|nr:uncharacterized protein BDP81DRAFT_1909 [Colletotrichum phormii]KAK1655282.1 hypothetical protein BDP81DRAFT_1909 [Colletotrichum phormii]